MKYFAMAIVMITTSCATHQDLVKKMDYEFKMATACNEPVTNIEPVVEEKNMYGQLSRGSYVYSCGTAQYSCQVWWSNYRYYRQCSPRI